MIKINIFVIDYFLDISYNVIRIGDEVMRKTMRGKLKAQKQILIISAFSVLLFFSVGYAAFTTTVRLNAKGNVHPTVKITVDDLKATALTDSTANGLYLDNSEGIPRYIYKGSNSVNNFIKLKENGNDVLYRIYSLEDDGTVKVIRDEAVIQMNFDADDATRRKGGYCTLNYCNAWAAMDNFVNGSFSGKVAGLNGNSGDSSIKEYIEGTYTSTLDDFSKIVTKTWNISGTTYNRDTIENAIADEKKSTWNGKISLLTASEYVRANTNTSSCGTLANLYSNYNTCKSTNYLVKSSGWWLLSPYSSNHVGALYMDSYSYVSGVNVNYSYGVRPSFYLCSGLLYSGKGTSSEPYEIAGGSCAIQNEP